MDDKQLVRDGYNAIGTSYLKTRREDSEDVLLLQELANWLPDGADVLDAGCGAGVPVTKTLCQTFNVTGVDFALNQLYLARWLVPQARFICQDITQLSFLPDSFDAVCSYYAIIHIPRRQHRALLLDFRRLLRPAGWALLCLGANDLQRDIEDFMGTRMHWSHFDAETNLKLVGECGFDLAWSKIVADDTSPGAAHLFVLAQKSAV